MFSSCCKLYLIPALCIGLIVSVTTADAVELPSPPGPHIKLIENLGDNSWLELGKPSPDPVWGRARGRKWTSKMAYAAQLRGGFLYGEGVHGWRNPHTGRYMDDLWFYDVMSHQWLNLYPGFDTRATRPILLNRDGFTSIDGKPFPIATMVHGYDMTAWDSDTQHFVSMPCPGVYWRKAIPSLNSLLKQNPQPRNRKQASPWLFNLAGSTWNRKRTNGPSPHSGFGDTLIYVPSRRELFFRRKNEVWFYDVAENSWTQAQPVGPPPPFGIEANSCLDPKRERIYIGGGQFPVANGPNALWIYDLATESWIDPRPIGTPGGNSYGTNEALLHCDLANDVLVLFRHKGAGRGIYVYDLTSNQWDTTVGKLPEAWSTSHSDNAVSGFYEVGLNVHLIHVAGDSRDNGRILAYRYKRRLN